MTEHDDRRREPRVPTRIHVDCTAASTFLFAYITDISSLGIFITTPEAKDPGTPITLRFNPPDEVRGAVTNPDAPFELDGVVRWRSSAGAHEPGMGIEFIAIAEETRNRLLELINAIAYLDDE